MSTSTLLFPCPACQNPVSPQATTCPKCGHPIRSQWENSVHEKPSGSLHIVFSGFAGLCLFAALAAFLSGFGQIGAGTNKVHTNEAEQQGKMRTGDPLDDEYNRKSADLADQEETAHGQFNIGVGIVLLIPAAVLWRLAARRKAEQ